MEQGQPIRERLPRLTDRLSLGKSGLSVSPACLGMTSNPDTVLAAYDAGVNFFFVTADMHWPYYEGLRQGLAKLLERGGGIRDRIVVAAVAYPTQPEFCSAPFAEVLEVLPKLGRLDVLIAGGAYGRDLVDRLKVYQDHRARGHVGARAIGVSFHDRGAAGLTLGHGLCDVGFIRYNPAHPGGRADLFPALARRPEGVRVFNFKNTTGVLTRRQFESLGLEEDTWCPRPQDGYRFALSRPELDGVLCALQSAEEVQALADSLEEGPLEQDEQDSMISLWMEYEERERERP